MKAAASQVKKPRGGKMIYLIIFLLWMIAGFIWSFIFGSIVKIGENGLSSSLGLRRDVGSEGRLQAADRASAGI